MTSAPRSTRREFLQGKAAADAVLEATALNGPNEAVADPAGSYLVQLARRAMACQFEVFLNAGQYDNDSQAALAALTWSTNSSRNFRFFGARVRSAS